MAITVHEPVVVGEVAPVSALSDAALLHSFCSEQNEVAFETLVRRHGPMVIGVCRRLLRDEHEAADAFQAVFIVLARKAASLREAELLGPWLYGVAYRTSLKARGNLMKRRAREKQVAVMPETPVENERVNDALEVLDEELRALPAKYQTPVVLCDLQGESRKTAAEKLDLPEGTLSSRLATARKKLAERLQRRGVVVTTTALASLLTAQAASAAIPATLLASSVQAAVPALAGKVAAGAASLKAVALSDGVLRALLLAKVQAVILAVAVPCLILGSAYLGVGALIPAADPEAEALAVLTRLGGRLTWEPVPGGRQLVGVDLRRTAVQNEHLKLLTVFKALRDLTLEETAVNDDGCGDIAALPSLKTLRLSRTGVSDRGVKQIAALTGLQGLTLGFTKTTGAAAPDIASLADLRELDLRGTIVGDGDIAKLAPLKKLQTLELGKTKVSDAGMIHIPLLPGLRTLRLEDTAVSDAGLVHIASQRMIETLSVEGNFGVTDEGVQNLFPLERLGSLNMSGTRVTDAGVRSMAHFSSLRWLTLERTAVTGAGFDPPTAFNLSGLWLSSSKVDDAGAKNIGALKGLRTLMVEKTGLTDAGVRAFFPLSSLELLSIDSTKATDAVMPGLAALARLNVLNLSGTKVTDAGIKHLAECHQLQWLGLHATGLTDAGLAHLRSLHELETLWLSWTTVTDAGLKHLRSLHRLGTLRLGGLSVSDHGMKDVVMLKNLHTLWLDWTKVTDSGLLELARLQRLEELRLDGAAVTDAGVQALAALKKLRRLEVQRTEVTEAGVRKLSASLPAIHVGRQTNHAAARRAERPRTFWWLLGGMGVLGFLGGLLLLRVNRKPVLVPALTCVTLAGLLLIGRTLFRAVPEAPAAEVAPKDAEVRVRRFEGHTGPVQRVRFTPDGKRLISCGGWPGRDSSIRIWDVATGNEVHRIQAPGQIGAAQLSADGRYLLVGSLGALMYIDVESGKVLKSSKELRQPTGRVLLSADGKHAYSASHDGFVRRWDLNEVKVVQRFRTPGKWARDVVERADGNIMSVDETGVIQIWNHATGEEIKRIETGPSWVASMALTPDGNHVILGTWDATVYDLETGRKKRGMRGHKAEVTEIGFTPDKKKIVTASMDGTVRLWDLETAELLQTLHSQKEFVFAAEFSRDGKYLATGGGGRREGKAFAEGKDFAIRVYEMPASAEVEPAATHESGGGTRLLLLASVGAGVLVLCAAIFVVRRWRRAHPSLDGDARAETAVAHGKISFTCPSCGKRLRTPAHLAGKKLRCRECGVVSRIPPEAKAASPGEEDAEAPERG